jgi:hypothetical protein
MLIQGKIPESHEMTILRDHYKSNGKTMADHTWSEDVKEPTIKNAIDTLRNSSIIRDTLLENYPGSTIRSVPSIDEVFVSVSPLDAKASDRVLVDCHYDAPYKFIEGPSKLVRIILALNDNSTVFTQVGDKTSKLSTGDFNGIEYNRDYHCVRGTIPSGKTRLMLKLHYLVIPDGTPEIFSQWSIFINWMWTKVTRFLMRNSANPTNPLQYLLAYIIQFARFFYNQIWYFIILLFVAWYLKKRIYT